MSARESLLGSLPPYESDDPSVQNVMTALGAELDRLDAAATQTINDLLPQNATDQTIHLSLLEALFGLNVPTGSTEDDRRSNVLAHLRGRIDASGLTWIKRMSELLGGSWTHQESGYTVTIRMGFPAGGPTYAQAVAFARKVTPAHLALVFVNLDRFLVEESPVGHVL
jgi:uncharacterized protein YmfQ (DUF2313 family)